jgi:hypothetical protein
MVQSPFPLRLPLSEPNLAARLPPTAKPATVRSMFSKRSLAVIFAASVAALVSHGVLAEGGALELPEGAVVKVEIVEPPRDWLDRAPEWIAAVGLIVGAFVGFFGGTVYNHKLEIRRREIQHDDEVLALACALYAELKQMWKDVEFVQVICEIRKDDGGNFESYEVELFNFHDIIYLENIPRLGLLGSQCANLVVEVYGRTASVERLIKAAGVGGGEPEWAWPELETIREAIDYALSALRDCANERRPGTIEQGALPIDELDVSAHHAAH